MKLGLAFIPSRIVILSKKPSPKITVWYCPHGFSIYSWALKTHQCSPHQAHARQPNQRGWARNAPGKPANTEGTASDIRYQRPQLQSDLRLEKWVSSLEINIIILWYFFFLMYGFWLLELGLKKGMEWRICGNIWRDGKHRDLRYFQSLFGPCTFCVCRCIGRVAAHTGWGKGHQGRMCYYWHYWDLLDCWHMVIKRANWLWSVLVLILKLSIHTGPLIACARVRIASTAPSL